MNFDATEWFLVEDADGTMHALHERPVPATENDFTMTRALHYATKNNEPLDLIALQFLGDTRKWPIIAELNWPRITNPMESPVGTNILIPPLEQT